MAITVGTDTQERIDIPEFVERVSRYLDPRDNDSIAGAAKDLRCLGNNKEFVVAKLNQELGETKSFQGKNGYTAQTIMLARAEKFFVRANLWIPPSRKPEVREWQNELFYYLVPHDHNFSFLTIGYVGSGYETVIWEYDPSAVVGEVGEKVKLNFLERTSLPEGKIMLYRAGRDVHSQEHPKEFSVSLNLMVITPEVKDRDQYLFDVEGGKISAYAQHGGTSQVLLCKLAGHLGNRRTISLLERLAHSHASPRVRLAALESWAELSPQDESAVFAVGLCDQTELVRRASKAHLDCPQCQ